METTVIWWSLRAGWRRICGNKCDLLTYMSKKKREEEKGESDLHNPDEGQMAGRKGRK